MEITTVTHAVVRSPIKTGLDCYMLSLRPSYLFRFLGHDPRSQHWKSLPPWLRGIYEQKQRVTSKDRISGLEDYITKRLMNGDDIGALPPISIVQFEAFRPGQLQDLGHNAALLDDDEYDARRVLIDGLARVTAMQAVRERYEVEGPAAFKLLEEFRFSVALYVPTEGERVLDADDGGQLFSDFNSYAWLTTPAKSLEGDKHNPYKRIAHIVGNSAVIRRHGGFKAGTIKLGGKDTHFTTELTLASFCKIAIEGRRGYGKLTRPLTTPKIASINIEEAGGELALFFTELERLMGATKFGDRDQIWRGAHGLYAIAVVLNDMFEGRTTMQQVTKGLATIDWTWNNPALASNIGRAPAGGPYRMNTGVATFEWLIGYCRTACNVVLTNVAQAA